MSAGTAIRPGQAAGNVRQAIQMHLEGLREGRPRQGGLAGPARRSAALHRAGLRAYAADARASG
jgi:hypothetical protein